MLGRGELDETEGVLLAEHANLLLGRLGDVVFLRGLLPKADLRNLLGNLLGNLDGLDGFLARLELIRELRRDGDEPQLGHVVHPIAHVRLFLRLLDNLGGSVVSRGSSSLVRVLQIHDGVHELGTIHGAEHVRGVTRDAAVGPERREAVSGVVVAAAHVSEPGGGG